MSVKIFHNPRCSKSRATLARLDDKQVGYELVKYLNTPPDVSELTEILAKLGMKPLELIRKSGEDYKKLDIKSGKYTDEELIELMVSHPILIERPIVVTKDSAAIGRPPENIDVLFE